MAQNSDRQGGPEGSAVRKNRNNYCSPGHGTFPGVWRLMRWLWGHSSLPMVQKCHRVPFGTGVDVYRQRFRDGSYSVSFRGYCRCSSAWVCPLCTPRNRRRRAELLAADLIGAVVAGRGLVFLTFTLPHDQGTALDLLFPAVTKAWNAVRNDRSVKKFFGDYGVDFARCTEVTWGVSGFHPHLHVAVVLQRPLTREEVQELRRLVFAPWCRSVQSSGFRPPSPKYGVHAINVLRKDRTGAIAAYLAKIQGLAQEMTRMDRKTRGKTIGPFEVLRRAVDGDARMAEVWHELERATKRKRSMTFSQTWAERVGSCAAVPDDGQLSEPDVAEAEWVGMLSNDEAIALSRIDEGHEVFMDLIGDESPECFRKAVEWLCLAVEAQFPDDPKYATLRGQLLMGGGLRGLLDLPPLDVPVGPGDDGGMF